MKRINKREDKGFEVQFYNDNGDSAEVVQCDTVEELAQFLARCCWGMSFGTNLPTVWKDGKKWCFGEYSEV